MARLVNWTRCIARMYFRCMERMPAGERCREKDSDEGRYRISSRICQSVWSGLKLRRVRTTGGAQRCSKTTVDRSMKSLARGRPRNANSTGVMELLRAGKSSSATALSWWSP